MTMIIKATKVKSIRHADTLAKHLLRTDDNEQVEVLDIRGTARPDDLAASLRSMQRATALTDGKTGLFHVAINPREEEADQMTAAQWGRSLQAIEKEFKLQEQPRTLVRHTKNGRTHLHAVYQLTDTEKGKLIDIKHDYYRCQDLGRKLEAEFSHERTSNAPSRDSYTRQEQQRAKRKGEKVPEQRQGLRDDYASSKDVSSFKQRLAARGYALAQGDRAVVVLVDKKGTVYGLTRELGIKLDEAKRFLGDEVKQLPTVEHVKAQWEKEATASRKPTASIDDSQEKALAMLRHHRTAQQDTTVTKETGWSYSFKLDIPAEKEKQTEPSQNLTLMERKKTMAAFLENGNSVTEDQREPPSDTPVPPVMKAANDNKVANDNKKEELAAMIRKLKEREAAARRDRGLDR